MGIFINYCLLVLVVIFGIIDDIIFVVLFYLNFYFEDILYIFFKACLAFVISYFIFLIGMLFIF